MAQNSCFVHRCKVTGLRFIITLAAGFESFIGINRAVNQRSKLTRITLGYLSGYI